MESVFDEILKKELGASVEFQLPDSFRKWKATDYISIKRSILFSDPSRGHVFQIFSLVIML